MAPPKSAVKAPAAAAKAPATKGTTTAKRPQGVKEKKKRGKTRKETYSSYVYKGMIIGKCVRRMV